MKKCTGKLLSLLLVLALLLSIMPMTAVARTIIPVKKDNVWISAGGELHWDAMEGATGYTIRICEHPSPAAIATVSVDAETLVYDLFGKMDDERYDNGDYRVEIAAQGTKGDTSIIFYYDSPYEKLTTPANLRWNGNVAEWDPVPDADYYNVYIRDTTSTGSLSVRSNLTETSVDLSYLSPQDGWYFEVIAFGAGYRFSGSDESPRRGGGSRTIIPVSAAGAMNLRLTEKGTLLWDKFDDATGYSVYVYEHPGNIVLKTIKVDKSRQDCELIDELDQDMYENGDYRIEVYADGSGSDHPYQSMIIYYDSPYRKLTAPANLRWNGLFAEWDAVPGAQYYNVYVQDTTTGSLRVRSNVKETFVALTDLEPQPGWYFEVVAYGSGCRHSIISESPRKGFIIGADTYNASTDELYSGGKVKVETEAGISDYSYVGESFEVSSGSEVAMTAQPDNGYEFVEWRVGSETGACYSKAKSIGFLADESLHLFAVFHKEIPAGVGTISNPVVCSSFEELKYALEHPTVQSIVVNSFENSYNQDFYTLQKEKDFRAGHCAITVPANTTKYLTINADINIRVPYVDYLLYSFIDNRGTLIIGGSGSLNVSMNARGYPSAILFNNGSLEIGGSVTFDPTNKSFDSVHGYSVFSASGHTLIYSGTFIGYDASAVSYQQGSMDIYGGRFKVKNGDDQAFGLNADGYLTVEEHDVEIYGGTFDGIRADQSIGADVPMLSDLLAYGAYYTYYSDGSDFDPTGKRDTHETLTVLMKKIIDEVELTLDPPKQNGKPSQTVACGDYSYKQATGSDDMWDDVDVYWEESTDGKTWTKMASNANFTVGRYYRAAVNVMPRKEGIFAIDAQIEPNVIATVNGYPAEVFRYPEEDPSELICVRFDFGILNDNIIEQIDIDGVTEPVVGEKPSYSCAMSGTGYTINTAYSNGTYIINGVAWYDVTDDYWLRPSNPNHTFEIGHQYTVFIDVKTEDGYEFYTEKVGGSYQPRGWGYINDNYATFGVQSDARYEQSLSWTFTCEPRTVKSVAVSGLERPVAGASPDFTAVTDLPDYYEVTSIEWMDYENNADEMTAESTFVAGNQYWLLITVEPVNNDGQMCKFVDGKTTATLNGVEVKRRPNDSWTEVVSGPKRVRIHYAFTASEQSLVPKEFVTQPVGGTLPAGESLNVGWETSFVPDSYDIQYWDGSDWDQWDCINEPENPFANHDFENNTMETVRFRVVAYLDGWVEAISNEFTITWQTLGTFNWNGENCTVTVPSLGSGITAMAAGYKGGRMVSCAEATGTSVTLEGCDTVRIFYYNEDFEPIYPEVEDSK